MKPPRVNTGARTDMSLRFFHVFFVAASVLMALGVGAWAVNAWQGDGATSWLALAGLSFGGAAGLTVYGSRFLKKTRALGLAVVLLAVLFGLPQDALACPACIGTSESPMQAGMNIGIMALLGVISAVLISFASFFVYLARRARSVAALRTQEGSI